MANKGLLSVIAIVLVAAFALYLIQSPQISEEPEAPLNPNDVVIEPPNNPAIDPRPEVQPDVPPEQPIVEPDEPQVIGPRAMINGRVLSLEIADSPEERRVGLMFRDPLPENHGMLFIFGREQAYSFWMMDMKFSLDIIWIDSEGIVVHVEHNVPPCSQACPSYQPDVSALFVLEVNAGVADSIDLKEGTLVELILE